MDTVAVANSGNENLSTMQLHIEWQAANIARFQLRMSQVAATGRLCMLSGSSTFTVASGHGMEVKPSPLPGSTRKDLFGYPPTVSALYNPINDSTTSSCVTRRSWTPRYRDERTKCGFVDRTHTFIQNISNDTTRYWAVSYTYDAQSCARCLNVQRSGDALTWNVLHHGPQNSQRILEKGVSQANCPASSICDKYGRMHHLS